jgi:hypothetical protein
MCMSIGASSFYPFFCFFLHFLKFSFVLMCAGFILYVFFNANVRVPLFIAFFHGTSVCVVATMNKIRHL